MQPARKYEGRRVALAALSSLQRTNRDSRLDEETARTSAEFWVGAITQACSRGAASTLDLGRLMSHARRSLDYGAWSRLWRSKRLPFSKRKGEMLVTIGEQLGELSDAQNSAHLPSPWNTLYYVARLGSPLVKRLIAQGTIHSALTLQEARILLAEHRSDNGGRKSRSRVKLRLARFAAFVDSTVSGWSDTERKLARAELHRLLDQISGKELL